MKILAESSQMMDATGNKFKGRSSGRCT